MPTRRIDGGMDAVTLVFGIGFLILVYLIVSFETANRGASSTVQTGASWLTILIQRLQGQ